LEFSWGKKSRLKLAAFAKKSIYGFLAFEGATVAVGYFGIISLRRSEKTRHYLYLNYPSISSYYYWAEDLISSGQKIGTRLRHSDLNRWLKEITENPLEKESD
jgi:hypothetical protein